MPQEVNEEEFPFPLTPLDLEILKQTDEEYVPHSWDELLKLIDTNRLDLFKRTPSDLRRYIHWSTRTKRTYGSIPAYILQRRLNWTPLPSSTSPTGDLSLNATFPLASPTPFASSADYTILPNDWPYGTEAGIAHLIVWLKTRLPVDGEGRLTAEGEGLVERFVEERFVRVLRERGVLGREEGRRGRVVWFKNWTGLQSVRALEHVHVMLNGVPEEVVREWTGGEGVVQEEG